MTSSTSTTTKPLPSLNSHVFAHVVSYVPLRRNFACVSRTWQRLSNHEEVWSACMLGDFELPANTRVAPVVVADNPQQQQLPTHTLSLGKRHDSLGEAWRAWREFEIKSGFTVRNGNLWLRSLVMWDSLKSYLQQRRAHYVLQNLQPGLSCKTVKNIPTLPEHMLVVYAVHNGCVSLVSPMPGLFGMVAFYDVVRIATFLPCPVNASSLWRNNSGIPFFRSTDGKVLRMFQPHSRHGNTPRIIDEGGRQYTSFADGLLEYFEHFCQQVIAEQWGAHKQHTEELSGMLSGFPYAGPRFSVAENEGIIISASWSPILADRRERDNQFLVTYEISIKTRNPLPVTRSWRHKAKLSSRTWLITPSDGTPPTRVHGLGVIGLYPEVYDSPAEAVTEEKEPFMYTSCTTVTMGTIMDGFFTFHSTNEHGQFIEFNVPVGRMVFNIDGGESAWLY